MINRVSSEAFSFSFASVSVLRVNVSSTRLGLPDTTATAGSSAAPAAVPANGGPDTVTVSPQALAAGQSASPATVEGTSTSDSGAPGPATTDTTAIPPTAPSASAQKIAALIKALDRNQDGALSEEEFVEGAKALLRGSRGHHHHRAHRHEAGDDDRDGRTVDNQGVDGPAPTANPGRARGLEKRLERAFGHLDADGSGSLTQEELVAALDRATGGAGPEAPAAPASTDAPPTGPEPLPPSPAPAAGAPAGSVNVAYSVTFVSIAVKSYQAVGQLAA